MKKHLFLILAALMGGVMQGASIQAIQVTFVQPQNFTDVKESWSDSAIRSERYREYVFGEFRATIVKAAQRLLSDGQRLEVRITDVDLAGDFEPWRGMNFDEIRILKDIYPPRVDLEYRLLNADGSVLREGKRELREMAYLMVGSIPSSDSLRYDKDMLRSWVRDEFRDLARAS